MKYLLPVLPLIIGFILDTVLGDPYSMPHPVRLIGNMISACEKMVRETMPRNLRLGGTLLAIAVSGTSFAVSLFIVIIAYMISPVIGVMAEGVLCYYLIAAKCLKTESMKVHKAIAGNDTEGARRAVSMIVGRDTERLDEKGIIKAAVETVAENTSDGVTAPVMFMALGGAPLGFFYKAVNTMDSMIGYKNEKYAEIGRTAAKLDDVLNYIPSRLTALAMTAAAFILGYDGKGAYRIWKRDRRNHASPNSAQTESACAGALGVQLSGDAYYFGELHKKPYIGDKKREIENGDILRANRLMYGSALIITTISVILRSIIIGGLS